MNEFETVLQECLRDLEQGASDVQECLQRHPKYANQLEPILLTSAYLARGREARLSPAFQARVRNRLLREMHAHPRKTVGASFGWMRLAMSLAILMLALLVTGTVYAQRAIPGEVFYGWKLASEQMWRSVSPDLVGTDLALAERRLHELRAVQGEPSLQAQTLDAYLEVVDRLRSQVDAANRVRILAALESHAKELNQLGILPEGQDPAIVPPVEIPTLPPVTAVPPVLVTPQENPTDVPPVLPTVQVVPEVIPTLRVPTKILPTFEIPPPIP